VDASPRVIEFTVESELERVPPPAARPETPVATPPPSPPTSPEREQEARDRENQSTLVSAQPDHPGRTTRSGGAFRAQEDHDKRALQNPSRLACEVERPAAALDNLASETGGVRGASSPHLPRADAADRRRTRRLRAPPIDEALMRERALDLASVRVALAAEEADLVAAAAGPDADAGARAAAAACEPEAACCCDVCQPPEPADEGGATIAQVYRAMGGTHDPSEPRSLKEALSGPYANLFKVALDKEMQGHEENETWVEVDPTTIPAGATVLGSTPVLSLKSESEAKVRIVAHGHRQTTASYDPAHISSPTVRPETIRTALALTALEDRDLFKLDVSMAYCHARLKETIYMRLYDGRVVRLLKALYGLKQAGLAWYELVVKVLGLLGLHRTGADRCLFVGTYRRAELWLYAYVDDFNLSLPKNSSAVFDAFVEDLRKHFKLKVVPDEALFLGMRIRRHREAGTLTVDQAHYARAIVRRLGLEDAKSVKTPLPAGLVLSKEDVAKTDEERALVAELDPPKTLGELLYLARNTRHDLLQAVCYLCRFTAYAGPALVAAVKHLGRYISGTLDYGLSYSRDGNRYPHGYCDSDWAFDLDTRKSCTGEVWLLAGAPIIASSKLQGCVALSSTQAEYQAASAACRDALWLRQLLSDLGRARLATTLTLRADNEGAIALTQSPAHHDRSKHIDVVHHFVRELVERRIVHFVRVATADNVADLLTKSLHWRDFERHRPAFATPLAR
jgi:Reverse transcriptase (RNA-dependent DNA polymerase)